MISDQLQELACLHALGALTPEEARAFEEQLARDPELRDFRNNLDDVTDALARDAGPAAPPPQLKSRVLAAIDDSSSRKIVPFVPPAAPVWIPWAIAASFALLAGGLVWRNTVLQERLGEAASQRASVQSELTAAQIVLGELKARDQFSQMRIAMLTSALDSSSSAIAVWDPGKQDGLLVVQNLPPLPPDKDYQLWVIDKQAGVAPVDGGTFTVDEKGFVRFPFKPRSQLAAANTFAVTLERKGGVVASTNSPVLAGNFPP